MLADERVDVVHVTTPNHLHHGQVRDALAAGKHVVCEKPLATTSAESAELLDLAQRSGLVHCTNFNLRFYPMNHQARALVASGALGAVWNVHGGYLQDWLLYPTDWNWRLEPEKGGALRAVADIGSHWMDLAQWVTGRRIERGLRRPEDGAARAAAADRRGGDVRRRGRRRARGCGDDNGGHRPSAVPAGGWLRGRGRHLAGQRRAEEQPAAGGGRLGRLRSRGTPSGTRSCGSVTATVPNETLLRNPGLLEAEAQAQDDAAGRPCGGVRGHVPRALSRRLLGRRRRRHAGGAGLSVIRRRAPRERARRRDRRVE